MICFNGLWLKLMVIYVMFFFSGCCFSVKINVGTLPSNICESLGRDSVRSNTTRIGLCPYQLRTVSDGLSNKAVRLPTIIASASALFLCTNMEVRGEERTTGFPSVRSISIKWSADSAHFSVMKGPAITAQLSQQEDNEEFRNRPLDETQTDLGSRECLRSEKNLAYYPAETDVSIRPGWFYHEEEDDKVRSFENLKEIYLSSVGGNTTLLLNLPPMKNGKLHPTDVQNVKLLGEFIKDTFNDNLADIAELQTIPEKDIHGNSGDVLRTDHYDRVFENAAGNRELTIQMRWKEKNMLSYLVLKEAIPYSQRVEKFSVWYAAAEGKKEKLTEATTIGYKKIVDLQGIETDLLEIHIEDARVAPVLSFVGVYK